MTLYIDSTNYKTNIDIGNSGRYMMPLEVLPFNSFGVDKNISVPTKFIVPLESGIAFSLGDSIAYDYRRTRLIETDNDSDIVRRDINASFIPAAYYPDGSVKILHIHTDIRYVENEPLKYHLEWYQPTPIYWQPSGVAPTGCDAVDCTPGLDPFLICQNFVGLGDVWAFFNSCEPPCCIPNITPEQLALIGQPCPQVGDGIPLECISTISGYSIINEATVSNLAVSQGINGLTLNDDATSIVLLMSGVPVFNYGNLYIKDINDKYYIPQNMVYNIYHYDPYKLIVVATGELANSGTIIANYFTSIEYTHNSHLLSFSHRTNFKNSIRESTTLVDNASGLYSVSSGIPYIAEHCFLFNNFSGDVLTKNFANLSPYSVVLDETTTKINLWPTGVVDTNIASDYSANNIYKLSYLSKGSGGYLNFTQPTGYSTLGQLDFADVAMGIEFAVNIGTGDTNGLMQHAYTQNIGGIRRIDEFVDNRLLDGMGTYTGEYKAIDDTINNAIIGYYSGTHTRHGVSGWNIFGFSHGIETYETTGLVLPSYYANNATNILSLAWLQYLTSANTDLLQHVRIGTNHLQNVRYNKLGSLSSPSSIACIGEFDISSQYNHWDVFLYSWLFDASLTSYFSYNNCINAWSIEAGARRFRTPCSGGTECSGIVYCNPVDNTLTLYESCNRALMLDIDCYIVPVPTSIIGSPCTTGVGFSGEIEYIPWTFTPYDFTTIYDQQYEPQYTNLILQTVIGQRWGYWNYETSEAIVSLVENFRTNNPNGLVNKQTAGYVSGQLSSQMWLPFYCEQYSYCDDYLIMSADNLMTGTMDGYVPLGIMSRAYYITNDAEYLQRYAGIVHQIKYSVYSGSNTTWKYYSADITKNVDRYLSAWPYFKGALQTANITRADIPFETGTYPNGMKVYINNTGAAISNQTVGTYWVGEAATSSNLNVRQSSGTSSYLIENMQTFSAPLSLPVNLRTSTWTEYQETCTGSIPTGISQVWSDGLVSLYYPVTNQMQAAAIPSTGVVNVSLCSGTIQPYGPTMSGTFKCMSTNPHGYVELNGNGYWLLPNEQVTLSWTGAAQWMVNCQGGSYIQATFSGSASPNLGLFGNSTDITSILPLVSGLNF